MKQASDRMIHELRLFKEKHGHCYILPVFKGLGKLRKFVARQITLRKQGKLTKERESLLSEIGVDWNASGAHWLSWERKYCLLYNKVKRGEDPNVSQLERGLGPWLSTQRVQYRQDVLLDGRKLLLEKLGVSWNPSETRNSRWESNFKLLLKFKEEHGHCDVPRRRHPEPGVWVSAQRTAYRKKTLSAERIAKLESIGFNWKAGGESTVVESRKPLLSAVG